MIIEATVNSLGLGDIIQQLLSAQGRHYDFSSLLPPLPLTHKQQLLSALEAYGRYIAGIKADENGTSPMEILNCAATLFSDDTIRELSFNTETALSVEAKKAVQAIYPVVIGLASSLGI